MDWPEVLSALSLPHAHPQLRKLKSNLVHPLPKTSALPPMLSAKRSPTRRDAKRSSTNTAPTLEDMLMLDLSDMLSNVKLMLKLTHNIWVMVDSTTDSDMPDMPTPPLLPSPSTPSPRLLVKPELPKSSNPPSSPTMELTLTAD